MKPVKVVLHLFFGILIFTVDENVNCPNTFGSWRNCSEPSYSSLAGNAVLNFQSSIKVLGFGVLSFEFCQAEIQGSCRVSSAVPVIRGVVRGTLHGKHCLRTFLLQKYVWNWCLVLLCGCCGICSGPGQGGESLAGHRSLILASSLQGRGHPREDGEGGKEKRAPAVEWWQSSLSCWLQRGWHCAVPMGCAQSDALRRTLPCGIACGGEDWQLLFPKEFPCFMISSSLASSCCF